MAKICPREFLRVSLLGVNSTRPLSNQLAYSGPQELMVQEDQRNDEPMKVYPAYEVCKPRSPVKIKKPSSNIDNNRYELWAHKKAELQSKFQERRSELSNRIESKDFVRLLQPRMLPTFFSSKSDFSSVDTNTLQWKN